MALDLSTIPARGTYNLVGDIPNTGATPSVTIGGDQIKDNDDNLIDVIVAITPEIDTDGTSKAEGFYLTGGSVNSNGTVTYTASVRALKGIVSNLTPTVTDSLGSGGYKGHTSGAAVVVDPTATLVNMLQTFNAATQTKDFEAGEAIAIREGVSLHTDGKIYKYHKTNYPVGIGITTEAITISTTGAVTLFGGDSTGHAGLTIGGNVYLENTGAVTQTSSATTLLIGYATSATEIRLGKVLELDFATQAEAEAGTDETKPMNALRTKQAIDANPIAEFADDEFRILGSVNATRKVAIEADGISDDTTRTITVPDEDVDLGTDFLKNSDIGAYPQNVYVSAGQAMSGSTTYQFTHSLTASQADVESGRYKVVVLGKNGNSDGEQHGDSGGSLNTWGSTTGATPSFPSVSNQWSSSDPANSYTVNWQSSTLKITTGVSGLLGSANRLIIQKMY